MWGFLTAAAQGLESDPQPLAARHPLPVISAAPSYERSRKAPKLLKEITIIIRVWVDSSVSGANMFRPPGLESDLQPLAGCHPLLSHLNFLSCLRNVITRRLCSVLRGICWSLHAKQLAEASLQEERQALKPVFRSETVKLHRHVMLMQPNKTFPCKLNNVKVASVKRWIHFVFSISTQEMGYDTFHCRDLSHSV